MSGGAVGTYRRRMPSRTSKVALAFALGLLALPGLASADVGQNRTAGAQYDRNASVVEAGPATYLFFARSHDACNRLAGCNPDNQKYDMYVKKSLDGGRTFGPSTLAAANPEPSTDFRGRTIAATALADGRILAFWADGGSQRQLYVVEKAANGETFSPAKPVAGDGVGDIFNVEAVTRGSSVLLYTEEADTAGYGVYARVYEAGTASQATLVEGNRNLPKAIVDRTGAVRITYTDATTWPQVNVLTETSADGLTWPQPGEPAVTETGSNWDPNLVQRPNGLFELYFAPDRQEGTGRQQVGRTVSRDFADWAAPVDLTPGVQGGVEYWDYWPEPRLRGNQIVLYYTSERATDTTPSGTGHIWTTPGFGGTNGTDSP